MIIRRAPSLCQKVLALRVMSMPWWRCALPHTNYDTIIRCWKMTSMTSDIINRRSIPRNNPPKEVELLYPHPLSDEIREPLIAEGFKPLSLAKFNGCNDPYEHVASINMQMTIIGASNSLKFKMLLSYPNFIPPILFI